MGVGETGVGEMAPIPANNVIIYSAAHDADLSTFVTTFLGTLDRLYYAV